jgi:hypothetical protein
VLEALQDAELVEQQSHIHAGERAGGYVQLFLEQASEGDSALFTQALEEALGPLRRPRYVIPRMADVEQPTLLSRWLPGALGRYFARRIRQVVMVHAVPAALSRSKAEATLFEHRWNQLSLSRLSCKCIQGLANRELWHKRWRLRCLLALEARQA